MGRLMHVAALLVAAVCLPACCGTGAAPDEREAEVLPGDECAAEGGADCAVSALQLRSQRVGETLELTDRSAAAAGATSEAESAEEVAARQQAATEAAEAAADVVRALLSPRHRYNSTADGARRAPSVATMYDGLEDRRHVALQSDGSGMTHVFAVGDWGAILPNHYTAPNKRGQGKKCPGNCEYVKGIDDRAQLLVANVMKQRAATSNPQYVLNVGDNFYWGGVRQDCGAVQATSGTSRDFESGWQGIYGGLANVPWISCLGNHDYGGVHFNSGWPQQIAYSFVNKNWIMPARYYTKTMYHDGYSVEYFVIDTNAWDAKAEGTDAAHNICGPKNPGGANCAAAGGPASVHECKSWFWNSFAEQKEWLKGKLAASKADWQIVVTHFPCDADTAYWKLLHEQYGLDFLVTGHRHDQELVVNSPMLGGMSCIVSGGGGGITSEHPTHGSMSSHEYGFFDLTLSKEKIRVELIALSGAVIDSAWVYPQARGASTTAAPQAQA